MKVTPTPAGLLRMGILSVLVTAFLFETNFQGRYFEMAYDLARPRGMFMTEPPPSREQIYLLDLEQTKGRNQLIQAVVTGIVLLVALYIILSKKGYGPKDKHWAYGTVGFILGFWLKL